MVSQVLAASEENELCQEKEEFEQELSSDTATIS